MNDYVAGSTNVVESVFIPDSASTTGAGKTGLAYDTSGLTCYYKRSNGTAAVAVSLVNITTLGAFVSGGFKEVDATHMPGDYEFHPPDAAFAAGAKWVKFYFVGASGMVATRIKVRIKAVDPDDAVRGGMTALPAAVANAANGLPTKPSGDTVLGQLTVGPTYTPFIQPMAVWVVANDASHYCKLSDNYALAYGSVDGWSVIWNVGAGVWKVTRPDGSIYAGGYYHSIAGESQYSYESGPTDWDAMYTTPAAVAIPGDAMTLTSDYDAAKTAPSLVAILGAFAGKLASVPLSHYGIAQDGAVANGDTLSYIILDAGASSSHSHYRGQVLAITGGTGAGQACVIYSYNGDTKKAEFGGNGVSIAPDATSEFAILPSDWFSIADVQLIGGLTSHVSTLIDLLTNCYNVVTHLLQVAPVELTSDYEAAKTAASETTALAIKAKTDLITADAQDDSDLEAKLDEIIENTGASPGAIETTLVIKSSGQPVQGAQVWVTTDSAGENTVAGASPTDVDGKVVFYLEAGTYYRFAYKPGYTFTNPSSFTVTA